MRLNRRGFIGISSAAAANLLVASPHQAGAVSKGTGAHSGTAEQQSNTNNSALIPIARPASQVFIEGASPDWVKTLVIVEVRVETATPEGTFASAIKVLDHYEEMGVNGLWVGPIYNRHNSIRNGYVNFGPNTVYPALTGSSNLETSLHHVRRFIDEAHRRNIRIFLDIIVWGTAKQSPLVSAHPEFYAKNDGKFVTVWGGYQFDWNSHALRRWYKDAAVHLIEKTGADGFRVDLAPGVSGTFFGEIRNALYSKGRKIVVISEMPNSRRDIFDFEQVGVTGWTEEPDYSHPSQLAVQERKFGSNSPGAGGRSPDFLFRNNIVRIVRTGKGIGDARLQQAGLGGHYRFYTYTLLDHDDPESFAKDNRVRFAYATIFGPFIPLWWIGAEWNNPITTRVAYTTPIDWNQIRPNQAFYEDVKKYIRIRRTYLKIFQCFSEDTRNSNIAKLETTTNNHPNSLQAYARFAGGEAVLIVPNYSNGDAEFRIAPDYAALCLPPAGSCRAVDLMAGEDITRRLRQSPGGSVFTARIAANHIGVYLLEAQKG